jgi:hypothetical protein
MYPHTKPLFILQSKKTVMADGIDSVGQPLKTGDKVAFKERAYISMRVGIVHSFTKGGSVRVANSDGNGFMVACPVKVFNQDL